MGVSFSLCVCVCDLLIFLQAMAATRTLTLHNRGTSAASFSFELPSDLAGKPSYRASPESGEVGPKSKLVITVIFSPSLGCQVRIQPVTFDILSSSSAIPIVIIRGELSCFRVRRCRAKVQAGDHCRLLAFARLSGAHATWYCSIVASRETILPR